MGTDGCQFDAGDRATWPGDFALNINTEDRDFHCCRYDTSPDSEYCWLHRPPAERPPDVDEQEQIKDRIQAAADTGQQTSHKSGTVNLEGIKISELNWDTIVTKLRADSGEKSDTNPLGVSKLDIRCAYIEGAANFSASLEGDGNSNVNRVPLQVDLSGATVGQFSGRKTTFEKELELKHTQIGGEGSGALESEVDALDCSNAEFDAPVRLKDATIMGGLNLGDVEWIKELDAQNLTVDGPVSLDDLSVIESINLKNLTCLALSANGAHFRKVTLQGSTIKTDADLDQARFHPELAKADFPQEPEYDFGQEEQADQGTEGAQLSNLTVEGDLNFHNTVFHNPTELNGLAVGGELTLNDATFQSGANLKNAELSGPVRGKGIKVNQKLQCKKSTFHSQTNFSKATFEGKAIFHKATFEDRAQFDRAKFIEPAEFDDAIFRDDSDFRAIENGDEDADAEQTESSKQTRAEGVFLDEASFVNTHVEGVFDARIIEGSSTNDDEEFDPSADVVPDGITVDGDFDARGARLTNAKLSGFAAVGEILLTEADLTGAKLRDATLTQAQGERADFSSTNLFGASLDRIYAHGTEFQGARIDDQTVFLEKVQYHHDADGLTGAAEDANLSKAISLYSQLETLARNNGQSQVARNMFVGRKHANERQLRINGDYSKSAFARFQRYVMNYGESYMRVLGTSLLLIVAGAILYFLTDLTSPDGTEVAYHGLTVQTLDSFILSLLFSTASFTALGSSGFTLGPRAGALAVIQAGIGIIMFGILLLVLQRRTVQ